MNQLNNGNVRVYFLRLSAILAMVMTIIVCSVPKSVSFIAANPFHTSWLNIIFEAITNLGDGIFAALLVIGFWIYKQRIVAIQLLVTYLLSGLIAQILKHQFHAPRPKAFFNPDQYKYFIDGVTHAGFTSFPSGHSTTAFALAAILACHLNCRKWCVFIFTLAALVVYSRIYLGQHFIEDTLAGMILGTLTSLLIAGSYHQWRLARNQKHSRELTQTLTFEL